MRRFFVEPENITGAHALLTGNEARHIASVLRLAAGDAVTLFDGSGSYYETLITRVSPGRVETKIVAITPFMAMDAAAHPSLHLAVGLLKGKKMDFIIHSLEELLAAAAEEENGLKLIFWEEEGQGPLQEALAAAPAAGSAIVLVGPEGGFSQAEVTLAAEAGFQPVTLGRRILRAETAALAAAAILQHALGNLQ
jgi:16S rRNA (uracil1498-N3)-methyltransferase